MSARSPALVTAIIPTYRRPDLLRRAIESVLGQSFGALIVRVYDNASGDETADVAEAMAQRDPRVEYHRHASNIGAAANFEFGLRQVDTPYFSILSDDDYLLPGFYQRAVAALEKHPAAMFWAGATLEVDETGTICNARVMQWPREGLYSPEEGLPEMLGGKAPTWTGVVFRREVLERVGLPDRETLGPSDLDFMLRNAAAHPFVVQKFPVAVFSLNSASFSATQPLSSFWPGWQKMIAKLGENPAIPPAAKPALLARVNADARRMLLRRGAAAIAQGRHDFARDAAQALAGHYGKRLQGGLLRAIVVLCSHVPGAQAGYALAYRLAERGIVSARAELQQRYGHLLRGP